MSVEQIIQLTRYDDIASLRERLERTQASSVVLIVPERASLLRSMVSMKLLRRYAQQMELDITIVTADKVTADVARRHGVRVRGSLDKGLLRSEGGAELQATVRKPARPVVRVVRGAARLLSGLLAVAVLGAVLAVLALAAAVLAPEAIVTVVPASESIIVPLGLRASPEIRVIDSARGQLPAKTVQVLIEETGQVETTGRKRIPDAAAIGTVVFANRSLAPLTIPKGTIVRTSTGASVRFSTEEETMLPAGAFSTVRVAIKAVDPGPNGNVKAGTISIVEGPLPFR